MCVVLKQSMRVYSLHTRKGNIFVVYIICWDNDFPSKCSNKLLHDKRINNCVCVVIMYNTVPGTRCRIEPGDSPGVIIS